MTRGAYGTRGRRPAPTTLGERLKFLRLAFGWSQKALASRLGVAQQSISNWEKDAVPPIGAARTHLALLLGIPWEALESGIGFRVPDAPPSVNLAGEGLMATDEETKKPLVLPTAAEGEGWVVEAGSGLSTPLDPKAVLREIEKALREGGSVWVVVKHPKGKPAGKKKR
jgi:transcriptional regulator with XRE-family HTH domain